MSLFEWNASLMLGIKLIDEQHQKLVRIMNTLYDQLLHHNVRQGFFEALRELRDYVREHLRDEEELMRDCGYPRLEKHMASHARFAEHIDELFPKAAELDREVARQEADKLLVYLRDWLVDHIMGGDLLFAKFYQARNKD